MICTKGGKTMSYKVAVNGYLDSEGEHDILRTVLYDFGVGAFPLLTDKYGEHVLSDSINADFNYHTEYDYDNGIVTKTVVEILGYTMNIPVKAEVASVMNYLIQKEDNWNTITDSNFDFVYQVDNTYETHSELNVVFDFESLDEDISNEDIKRMTSTDNARLLTIMYEATKGQDKKHEQS